MSVRALTELLAPERLTEVVDVGANPIDGEPPYAGMLSHRLCRVTGFEPQPAALAALQRAKGPLETYLPDLIGDGAPATLRTCAAPGMTSLLEPDTRVLGLLEDFLPLGQVTGRAKVQTRRLDDVAEVARVDLLKIDAQGSELAVFRAGRAKLARAVAIQTEVSFLTLYENQPVFGEVDLELRAQGFVPHCFAAVKLWPLVPWLAAGNERKPLNQLLEADVVYVRDFTRAESLDDEQLRHLALVVHHCYGSHDLALRCVLHLEKRGRLPAGSAQRYLASLRPGAP